MLIISIEVITLSPSKTIKTAAVHQGYRHITCTQRYHMSNLQQNSICRLVSFLHLHYKATHLHQRTLFQQTRMDNLDKSTWLGSLIKKVVLSLHTHNLSMLCLNRYLQTANYVDWRTTNFQYTLLHHVISSQTAIATSNHHPLFPPVWSPILIRLHLANSLLYRLLALKRRNILFVIKSFWNQMLFKFGKSLFNPSDDFAFYDIVGDS